MVSHKVNEIASTAYAGWLREDATVEEMRVGFDRMCPEPPAEGSVTPAQVGGINGLWIRGPWSEGTTILHFHAGGYLIGSPTSHRDLAARIGRAARAQVFVADYRLAPENPFPAAFDDGVAAYRGILADGVDPSSLVVSGDSAGGGLALAVMAAARDCGDPLPAVGVLMSPWADLTLSGDSMSAREPMDPLVSRAVLTEMQQGYLQGADPADHRASPLLGNLAGLPPLLVQVGSSEVLEDDAVRIADGVLRAGGDAVLQIGYEMVHVFQMFADQLPDADRAIDQIGAYVRARVRSAGSVPLTSPRS
ncbi:alpha/beta hydrolase [Pseudonocardia endophytica]|uniref:Acetyl esterase/lipase n=1 Tax=Pseudonocardia endophytica TaxID=401976 RepID=A0A4R1HWG5_PSEEN|nr:alpha/beta hydrolase [Pseudonocardia endophytica]TCK21882.1 acetyl esterase/lipase [Pseudonocardia endophytica]